MNININIKNNPTLLYWVIVSSAIILGTYLRLKGLGIWPLALDEYYMIKSSDNILKYGLPQFPNGGYYERGILMQYLIAPLLALGLKAEFAGRIFSVISNLAAIPAVYLIAKRVGNQLIATIAVVIFSFSIWEIEFARFARMYAPFQTVFLWYIYFALKDFENKNFANFKWLILLSILSIFLYEGSIFLALLNFIPFLVLKKFELKYFLIVSSTLIFSLFFNLYSFKTINSVPIFPPEYLNEIANKVQSFPVRLPKILIPYSLQATYFNITTLIVISFTIGCVWLVIKNLNSRDFISIFSVIFLGITVLLNQFGLFLLSFLIFFLWNFFDDKFLNIKNMISLATIFFVNLIYWYSFGILSKEWYPLFNDFSSYSLWGVSKRLFVGFFNFPNNYISLLDYFRTLPILTIFAAITLSLFTLFILFKQVKSESNKFLFGIVIFMAIAANLPNILYVETRYTLFLVPLLLIIVLYSVYFFCDKFFNKKGLVTLSFIPIVLITFAVSKDFNLYHLTNIDNQDVNYRLIYEKRYKKHLYRRWDVKTPTDFVKKNLGENDLIMINENSMEYYLPRIDYFNVDYKHEAFVALTVEKGKKERWSNAKLIYKNEDLINFIKHREATIWYLVFPENWLMKMDFYGKYKEYLVCKGVDGLIKVYKFPVKNHKGNN